jgi:triosephosphate isomerase (TIM)
LIAGNWKMHGLAASLDEARAVAAALDEKPPAARVAICPPATLIHRLFELVAGTDIAIGGQDCRPEPSGAFTGSVSAEMLVDAGASLVILGHSERRHYYAETDAQVSAKACAAFRAGLEPIICIGETLEQHDAGDTVEVVCAQLAGSVPDEAARRDFAVAYEPIWAIGSGKTPTIAEIEATHIAIRAALTARFGPNGASTPILYGGSVKGANAVAILAVRDVGGALVGGASLTAADFLPIIRAA